MYFVWFFRVPSPTLRSHDNWKTSSQKLWISLLLFDSTSDFECKGDTFYFYISIFKCVKNWFSLLHLFLIVTPGSHLYFYMNLSLVTFLWLKVRKNSWCLWVFNIWCITSSLCPLEVNNIHKISSNQNFKSNDLWSTIWILIFLLLLLNKGDFPLPSWKKMFSANTH